MSRYLGYTTKQPWLLPPSIEEELGEQHLAVFLDRVVEQLDLRGFEQDSSEQGRPGYPPQMLLKVWMYAYATGLTSSRKLEQRLREDLGFRLLAGNLQPDFWTLNAFRRRYPRQLNDIFTQVVEAARALGLAKLGRVAIDSTRVEANASPDRSDSVEQLRRERARIRQRIRRWQKQCDAQEAVADPTLVQGWQQRLESIPRQLTELRKSGQKRASRTDPESRYLRRRGGFALGYTAEVAVSDDHIIVAQRVHREPTDNGSLVEMVEQVPHAPTTVLADSSYYSMPHIRTLQSRGMQVVVPDPVLAREWAWGTPPIPMNARQRRRHPGLQELRDHLRTPAARAHYQRRKAVVEPVFGVLKQQRGMRKFRCRGLAAVATEWTLATTAYNLTRLFAHHCRKS
jgi:transposase